MELMKQVHEAVRIAHAREKKPIVGEHLARIGNLKQS